MGGEDEEQVSSGADIFSKGICKFEFSTDSIQEKQVMRELVNQKTDMKDNTESKYSQTKRWI